jgi:hypothetical protein
MSKLSASFVGPAPAALLSFGLVLFGCQANTVPAPNRTPKPSIAPADSSTAKPKPALPDDAAGDDESEDRTRDDDGASGSDSCEPDCDARECGSDGCGGSCGRCRRGRSCNTRRGVCQDPPACEDPDAGAGDCPECGNGVIDSGEACDGEADCNPDCTRVTTSPARAPAAAPEAAPGAGAATPSLERCMGFLGSEASDACKECVCGECAEVAVACYDSGDPSFDADCGGLAECGNRNGCYDSSCYCGTSALCLLANGPCVAETERAAGSRDVITILNCYDTRGCASNRARTLGECLVRNCDAVCGP